MFQQVPTMQVAILHNVKTTLTIFANCNYLPLLCLYCYCLGFTFNSTIGLIECICEHTHLGPRRRHGVCMRYIEREMLYTNCDQNKDARALLANGPASQILWGWNFQESVQQPPQ